MIRPPYAQVPSLRLEQALQCPKCRQYNLVPSEDPDIYYYCPDEACGYAIWARPPQAQQPEPDDCNLL